MSGGRRADELLRLPVRLHGIQIGRPVDVILDPSGGRVVGFELLCGDDEHRFLPLAGARVGDDEIALDSALTLLDTPELSFYRTRARSLRTLRGSVVERRGSRVGRLDDVVVAADGTITQLVVDDRATPLGDGVRLPADPSAAPAA